MAEPNKAAVPMVDPAQPIRFGSVAGIVVQREFGVPEFLRPMATIGLLLPEPNNNRFLRRTLNRFEAEALAALLDVAADATASQAPALDGEVGEAGGVSVHWRWSIDKKPLYCVRLANRDEPRLDSIQAKALAALLRVAR